MIFLRSCILWPNLHHTNASLAIKSAAKISAYLKGCTVPNSSDVILLSHSSDYYVKTYESN